MVYVLLFIIGACVGSFLGVCIDRLPNNRSIIFGRSRCSCGKVIPYYLNIPILSWLMIRGRAQCCNQKIPIKFWLIEIISGCLLPILWATNNNLVETIIHYIFLSFLLVAAFIDFDTFLIPDKLSTLLAIIGILTSIIYPQIHDTNNPIFSIQHSLLGLFGGTGILFWIGILGEQIFKKEAIGLGDVQLIGAIGTFCGLTGCLAAIFGGSLIGTIVLLPIILRKYLSRNPTSVPKIVPFVPFLTIGTVIFILAKNIINTKWI